MRCDHPDHSQSPMTTPPSMPPVPVMPLTYSTPPPHGRPGMVTAIGITSIVMDFLITNADRRFRHHWSRCRRHAPRDVDQLDRPDLRHLQRRLLLALPGAPHLFPEHSRRKSLRPRDDNGLIEHRHHCFVKTIT